MSKNTFLEFIQKKFGDKLSVEDQVDLSKKLEARLNETREGITTELITPRTPTTGATLDAERQLQDLGIYRDRENLATDRIRQKDQLQTRAVVNDQDTKSYGERTAINTAATRAILGDYINARNDARNFYGDTHNREIAYSQGRNKQIFDYLDRGQDLQSRQMTQNFIMDLGKTAALLFS